MGWFLEPRKQTTGIHRAATANAHVSEEKEIGKEQKSSVMHIYTHDTHREEKGRSKEKKDETAC